MPQFSKPQALIYAFFSGDLYRDVARRWRGIAFLYFFLIFILAALPLAFNLYQVITHKVQFAESLIDQFPNVTVETDGTISTVPQQKYIITDPQTDKPVIIFDTAKTFNAQMPDHEAPIVVLKNGILVNELESNLYQFTPPAEVKHLTHVQYEYYKRYIVWTIAVVLAMEVLVYFFFLFGLVLLFALVAYLLMCLLKGQLPYAAYIRLGFVALTPALVLQMIKATALGERVMESIYFFGWELLFFMPYYIYAVFSNRPSRQKNETA